MIFSGSQLTAKRSFYTQTGNYGFAMHATVDNTTGIYHFGLSGAGAPVIDFRLESGHLYWGNTFIHAYTPYQQFRIECQFTSGAANIIKDGTPLVYGAPKPTGSYNYFYFTRQTAAMGGTFDLEVSGNNAPVYTVSQSGYLLSTGQNAVTGFFTNLGDYPINVFDSAIQSSAIYSFGKLAATVGARGSGVFAYTGDYSSIDFSQPILTTFNTNFGDITAQFGIIDVTSLDHFIQLTGPTNFGFNGLNVLNQNTSWLNYSGGVVVNSYPTPLTFRLTYGAGTESFTGAWNVLTGGSPTSLVALSSTTGAYIGSGVFPANNFLNLQVMYSGLSGASAQLLISGAGIINPVSQTLSFAAP